MWRVTRGITHPIVQLTDAAENVARDNGAAGLQPTVLIPGDADEVTRLRYAFERMAQRVAERQTLELQLRHAQKMEAVGRLAGGVAHDFNNLLTAIRSYADLMLDDMPAWDPKRGDALEIRNAATRAAGLTAQLLAFSRKQMLQPKVLDTGAVLLEVKGMLQRLLIEDIHMDMLVPAGLWRVRADRGQLEQVIVNLAVNSRDAMPHGGLLQISAVNDVVLDPIETRDEAIPPGDYVVIRVADSGVGMDAATLARAFEPFFTTKPTGAGTGLGLSTVHGIVHQSGGYVTIESAPQQGTTIAVYLPRVHERVDGDSKGGSVAQRGNAETILIVEDEVSVRSLARRVLEKTGYKVLEASSPTEAMRLAQSNRGAIDLVVSDVVMPEMNGPALVAKVLELCPAARVLFISGYADEEVLGRGIASGMTLLQKPFSAQELVERVGEVLHQKTPARA
jgi:two-component system cell cycle sensor histidine kinase/response regulator CckA